VSVVDAVIELAAEARHRLGQLSLEEDLDHVGMLPHLDGVTDETRRYGVRPAADADRAPLADDRLVGRVARHRRRRQRSEHRALFVEARADTSIDDAVHDLADEELVVLLARKVGVTTHEERLRQRALQDVVCFLDDAVLIRLAGLDACRLEIVVREHGLEAPIECAPAVLELVRRGGEIVGPDDLGHAAERPESALDAGDERLEGLAEGDRHPAPFAEAQHHLEEEVHERLAVDRHAELGGVGEVACGLASGDVYLLEEDLARRPVQRSPLAHPTLKRAD
jgi:hypothetical protein